MSNFDAKDSRKLGEKKGRQKDKSFHVHACAPPSFPPHPPPLSLPTSFVAISGKALHIKLCCRVKGICPEHMRKLDACMGHQ